jgi:ABC-type nitrate/sulfonate/bicarbonate transport system substrate-binding protein
LGDHAISWPGQSGQDYYFLLIAREQWLTPHAAAVKRFVQALVQTERFMRRHPDQAQDFLARRSHYGRAYMQYAWQRLDFVVTLSQALLIAM